MTDWPSEETSEPNSERADELVAELALEFSAPLFRQAVSIVRDHALAEDVVQESLLRAWLSYDSYRGDAPLGAWVMRIGHNTAISTLRRMRDEPRDPELLEGRPTPEIASGVVDRLAIEHVWEALNEVDALSRTILVLRDVQGYSYEEITEITDSTLAVVKTRLFRTRRLLADRLKEWR